LIRIMPRRAPAANSPTKKGPGEALADHDPRNDAQYLHSSNADGFRARRLTDRVEELIAAGGITGSDMIELQADTVSIEAERLLPFLKAARTAEPALVASLGLAECTDEFL
jgi:penicillin amidase